MEDKMGKESSLGGPLYQQALRETQRDSLKGVVRQRESGQGSPKVPEGLPEEVGVSKGGLTGLDLREPITRRRFLKIAPPAVVLALLLAFQVGEAAKAGFTSASELGPTPKVLPTPGEVSREMKEFEATIEAINQEPQMVVSEATPQPTEIQQAQKETSVLEKTVVAGTEISEIPSSTAPTLFFLKRPLYLNQIAERFNVTEDELLGVNKFLSTECDINSPDCPYYGLDPMILRGGRLIALPEGVVDVDETDLNSIRAWDNGVVGKGMEGRIFDSQSESFSIRATVVGLNTETGNLITEIEGHKYFEVSPSNFLIDCGFTPEEIIDNNFGEGLRWKLELSGQSISMETYDFPEGAAQHVALEINTVLPEVQMDCRFDINKIERIIYLTEPQEGVGASFNGVFCEPEGGGCRIVIKSSLFFGDPAHELCHGGNNVQLEDGSWIPVYSRIIDEGIAEYVGSRRWAEKMGEQFSPSTFIFGEAETLEQNNLEELRNETLYLDFNDESSLKRYQALTNSAGWAIWEINQTAVEKGHPDFFGELVSAARELARSEKRQVTGYDLVELAEEIWPEEGASLINRYHVLFIRAAWEEENS